MSEYSVVKAPFKLNEGFGVELSYTEYGVQHVNTLSDS